MFLYKHFVDPTVSSEAEDVVRNLRHVLGTRRGTGYFLPSFGLTGPGQRQGDEMLVKLMDEIAENLKLNEPRVELVGKIKESHDDDAKGARIWAMMRCRNSGELVRMTVHVTHRAFEFEILPPDAVKGKTK
jgi:phage baseplate assembly protein W